MAQKMKILMLHTLTDLCETVKQHQKDDGKIVDNDGKFATGPQAIGSYYATLYTYRHPDNKYYMDADILERAIKCMTYHTDMIDEKGEVAFYTYDQFWSRGVDAWSTLHLLNAIEMLRPHLPGDKLQVFETKLDYAIAGMRLRVQGLYGDKQYREHLDNHEVWNIFVWMVVLLLRYDLLKGNAENVAHYDNIMTEICAHQLPFGTWLEHGTLVVGYSHVTLGGLAMYSHYRENKHEAVKKACIANMEYLLKCYFCGTMSISCFDIRNRTVKSSGSPFVPGAFLDTEIGAEFCSRHVRDLWQHRTDMTDHLYSLMFFTFSFSTMQDDIPLVPERPAADGTVYIDKTNAPIKGYSHRELNTLKVNKNGFVVPICILTNKYVPHRWGYHRSNLFEVYHQKAGVIIGGGHSTADPDFATFNVIAKGISRYLHTDAKFINDLNFELWYGENKCDVSIDIAENAVRVRYRAFFEGEEGEIERVIVNIPVITRNTKAVKIGAHVIDTGRLDYSGLKLDPGTAVITDNAQISCDRVITAKYPVCAFNSYMKEQNPTLDTAFMILSCELDYKRSEMNLEIRI